MYPTEDFFPDSFEIPENIIITKTEYGYVIFSEEFSSIGVIFFCSYVTISIDFYDKFEICTVKINNIVNERLLSCKSISI